MLPPCWVYEKLSQFTTPEHFHSEQLSQRDYKARTIYLYHIVLFFLSKDPKLEAWFLMEKTLVILRCHFMQIIFHHEQNNFTIKLNAFQSYCVCTLLHLKMSYFSFHKIVILTYFWLILTSVLWIWKYKNYILLINISWEN